MEAFAALVGRRDVPAAALKSCQHIFPVSSCCAAEASALEAAVAAECEAAMNDGTKNPLGEKICRVAVAVHTRGDDSRAASANGAPPLARVPARDAALRAIMDARERANLPPVTLDLHNPDVVLRRHAVEGAFDGRGFGRAKRANLRRLVDARRAMRRPRQGHHAVQAVRAQTPVASRTRGGGEETEEGGAVEKRRSVRYAVQG